MPGIGISISIETPGTPGAAPPAAPTLTAPLTGTTHYLGQTPTVSATSTDGDLTRMDWVLDPGGSEVVIATDSTAPYSATWTVGTDTGLLGAHTLVARAVRGALSTDSASIPITVDEWALSWVAAAKVLQYVRADLGVTKDGSDRVSAWADQHTSAKDYTQGTGANQPLYLATGGPNSKPAVQLDSNARYLQAALALPNPAVTPTLTWAVFRQGTWTINYRALGSADNLGLLLWTPGTTPSMSQYNGSAVNANTAATLGSWFRLESYFSNSTSDRLKIGATNSTGAAAGTRTRTESILGSVTGVQSALTSWAELLYLNADASAGEQTKLDAYVTRRYGAGLV